MNFNFESPELKETRQGFADALVDAGKENDNIVVLGGDVSGSVKTNLFRDAYPDRFISVGVAEQDMMGTAAGLALAGKIPVASAYGEFATGRPFDQIRQSIAYSGKNVKICASHAGLTLGEDGATHQILEDIGLMKMLPGMTVIVPCDYAQTKAATETIAEMEGPVYLRFGRPAWPIFTKEEDFKIGKAQYFSEGTDVTIFACGHLVWNAIQAGAILQEKGISVEVINIHTIKPLDEEAVLASIKKTKCAVTAEEHNIIGGLGDAIAQCASKNFPIPIEYVGTKDTFGESGKPTELLKKYGLDIPDIVAAAEKAINRKKNS